MEIAQDLGIKPAPVLDHLWKATQAGRPLRPQGFLDLCRLPPGEQQRVLDTFAALGVEYLRPVYEACRETVSYDELKFIRLYFANAQ